MTSAKNSFETNGYAVLPNMVSREECQSLVDHLTRLRDQGKLVRDDQCPLSAAVYGDALLDRLLDQLLPTLSGMIERRLLPTYSYARLYSRGEVLKRHIDRPACEISATMTLGFEGERVWPIFFAREARDFFGRSVELEPGTLALYKGCELPHWRNAFDGTWQAQVFLHYVDADGPFAAEHLDRRGALGVSAARSF